MLNLESRLNSGRTCERIRNARRRGGKPTLIKDAAHVWAASVPLSECSMGRSCIARRLRTGADTLYRGFPGTNPDVPETSLKRAV